MSADNSQTIVEDVREPRVYEIGYHLLPTVAEDSLSDESDAMKKTLADLGGLPISQKEPEMMDLSYPMVKVISNKQVSFDKAYFGWIKFDVSPEKLEELKKALDENPNILRYLLISTVRENTIAPTKFGPKRSSVKRTSTKEEIKEAGPIDEAEVDKQIDELVTEDESSEA